MHILLYFLCHCTFLLLFTDIPNLLHQLDLHTSFPIVDLQAAFFKNLLWFTHLMVPLNCGIKKGQMFTVPATWFIYWYLRCIHSRKLLLHTRAGCRFSSTKFLCRVGKTCAKGYFGSGNRSSSLYRSLMVSFIRRIHCMTTVPTSIPPRHSLPHSDPSMTRRKQSYQA